MADESKPLQAPLRPMSDAEFRLHCLDLAVRSWRSTGRGHQTPTAVAQEYFDWVKHGKEPQPPRSIMGTGVPGKIEGFGHGEPPGAHEMTGDDLTSHAAGNKPASLRQGAAGKN